VELRNLRYFLAVAEEGGFRRASARLRIAQPAVSRRVRDLERELGVELLDRGGRSIVLTQAGTELFERARPILQALTAAEQRARDVGHGRAGLLHIGLYLAAARHDSVLEILSTFHAEHPEVRLDLVAMATPQTFTTAAGLHMDAAFTMDAERLSTEVNTRRVGYDRWAAFLRRDHRLASRGSISVRDLAGERIITFPPQDDPVLYDRLSAEFASRETELAGYQAIAGGELHLALAAAGLGVALTMSSLERSMPAALVMREIVDLDFGATVDLVWHEHRMSPALRLFLAESGGMVPNRHR
jgi:DNA-binding transcriptional LysR family regulator